MKIPIIYYHSISPSKNANWVKKHLTIELKYFEKHLKYFKKHNFKSLFLDEYFDLNNYNSKKEKYVIFSFDDGYLDNYIYVYPLLQKYGFKGTIFVSPEFVDEKSPKRLNLFHYWNKQVNFNDLQNFGFLNWKEMREMEYSGTIDIQSHTLTHTKYFVSDRLTKFHHPKSDSLYVIGNLFPKEKPYYINNKKFNTLIPFGYPIFEEKSAITARKIEINPHFNNEVVDALKNFNWDLYNFEKAYKIIEPIYNFYKESNSLINSFENEPEYKIRITNELKKSKEILETHLNKEINFCCWPHGDNNDYVHKTAIELGYKATTIGNLNNNTCNDRERIPHRIGLPLIDMFSILLKLKMIFKIKAELGRFPFYQLINLYSSIKNKY